MATLAVSLISSAAFNAAGISWFGMSAASTGWMVGSLIGGYLFQPKLPNVVNQGTRLEDLTVTASTYGIARPFGYGTYKVSGNIIAASNKYETVHKDKYETGKGGGGSVTNTSYTYSIDLAVGLGEGEVSAILQIYANEKLIYDAESNDVVMSTWLKMQFYSGSEIQQPDPTLQALYGDHTPAYRGESYVVFSRFQLAEFGNQIPNFKFVISRNTNTYNNSISEKYEDGLNSSEGWSVLVSEDVKLWSLYITDSNKKLAVAFRLSDLSEVYSIYGPPDPKKPGYRCRFLSQLSLGSIPEVVGGTYINTPDDKVFGSLVGDETGSYIACWDKYTGKFKSMREVILSSIPRSTVSCYRYKSIMFIHSSGRDIYRFDFNGISPLLVHSHPAFYTNSSAYCGAMKSDYSGAVAFFQVLGGSTTYIFAIKDETYQTYYKALPSDKKVINFTHDLYNDLMWAFCTSTNINDGGGYVYIYDRKFNIITEFSFAERYGINASIIGVGTSKIIDYNEYNNTITVTLLFGANNRGFIIIDAINNKLLQKHENAISVDACNSIYSSKYGSIYACGQHNTAYKIRINSSDYNYSSLDNIVDNICYKSGYLANEFDSSDLSAIRVDGHVCSSITNGKSLLQQLGLIYLFDIVDDGSKINFLRIGNGDTHIISESELIEKEGKSIKTISIIGKYELPTELSITYINPDKYYEHNTQTSKRLASSGRYIRTVEAAISLTDDQAAAIADILLHLVVYESENYEIVLPYTKIYIKCGDIITFTINNISYTGRIIHKRYENGVIILILSRYNESLLLSTKTGASTLPGTATISASGDPILYIIDIPALRSQDFNVAYYYASNSASNFDSGILYEALDSLNYNEIGTLPYSTIGNVINAVDCDDVNRWSYNDIDISLTSGELSSITEIQCLNNLNVAAWGVNGRWEIICFQNATLNLDGTYTLNKILRGRRNTGVYCNIHQDNDAFILLTGSVKVKQGDISNIGQTFNYIAAANGRAIDYTGNYRDTIIRQFNVLRPFAPTHLFAGYTPDDIACGYKYRVRSFSKMLYNPNIADDNDIEVDVININTGYILRTITSTPSANGSFVDLGQQRFIYKLLDYVEDGSVTNIAFNVYCKSSNYGRGNYEQIVSNNFKINPFQDLFGNEPFIKFAYPLSYYEIINNGLSVSSDNDIIAIYAIKPKNPLSLDYEEHPIGYTGFLSKISDGTSISEFDSPPSYFASLELASAVPSKDPNNSNVTLIIIDADKSYLPDMTIPPSELNPWIIILNGEKMLVTGHDEYFNLWTLTVTRGILGTIPSIDNTHGDIIYIVTDIASNGSEEYNNADNLTINILPYIGDKYAITDESNVTPIYYTIDSYQYKPFAPGNVLVNNFDIFSKYILGFNTISIDLSHRNRLNTISIIGYEDISDDTQESNTVYYTEIYDNLDNLLNTYSTSSKTNSIDTSISPINNTEGIYKLVTYTERNGVISDSSVIHSVMIGLSPYIYLYSEDPVNEILYGIMTKYYYYGGNFILTKESSSGDYRFEYVTLDLLFTKVFYVGGYYYGIAYINSLNQVYRATTALDDIGTLVNSEELVSGTFTDAYGHEYFYTNGKFIAAVYRKLTVGAYNGDLYLYESTDFVNWTQLNTVVSTTSQFHPFDIYWDSTHSRYVLIGTKSSHWNDAYAATNGITVIYYTTDFISYTQLYYISSDTWVTNTDHNGSIVIVTGYQSSVLPYSLFLISTDDGATWNNYSAAVHSAGLSIIGTSNTDIKGYISHGNIVLVSHNICVYSDDNGSTWNQSTIIAGITNQIIITKSIKRQNGDIVLGYSNNNGVYDAAENPYGSNLYVISQDGGVTWSNINEY